MTLNELGQLTVSIGDMITQIPRRTCFLTAAAAAADQHVSLIAESLATQYSLPPCAIWVDGCLLSPNAVISEVYNGQYAEAVAMRHRSVWRAACCVCGLLSAVCCLLMKNQLPCTSCTSCTSWHAAQAETPGYACHAPWPCQHRDGACCKVPRDSAAIDQYRMTLYVCDGRLKC